MVIHSSLLLIVPAAFPQDKARIGATSAEAASCGEICDLWGLIFLGRREFCEVIAGLPDYYLIAGFRADHSTVAPSQKQSRF